MALKDKVLEILEDNRGRSVSGNKIAVSLGMTRSAVRRATPSMPLQTEDTALPATMTFSTNPL